MGRSLNLLQNSPETISYYLLEGMDRQAGVTVEIDGLEFREPQTHASDEHTHTLRRSELSEIICQSVIIVGHDEIIDSPRSLFAYLDIIIAHNVFPANIIPEIPEECLKIDKNFPDLINEFRPAHHLSGAPAGYFL